MGNVVVHPGDIVFGDVDGVCILPSGAAGEVFKKAFEKVRTENLVRDAMIKGMGAAEAFDTFGVM
jgi:regulator of RNase E activity RraA